MILKNLIGQMFNLDFVGDYATRDGLILQTDLANDEEPVGKS